MKPKSLDFNKLDSKDPKVKYGFTKELLKIGESDPGLLYDYFEFWTDLITSDKNIIKWTAIDILGYISSVDKDNLIPGQIGSLYKILHSGNLITCNHAIFALGLIAKNNPNQRAKIIKELVKISTDTFETEECKAIATGKVIEAIKDFPEEISANQDILRFIKNAQLSQRNATKKKADSLITKLTKELPPTRTIK
jgi:hypothetical protein